VQSGGRGGSLRPDPKLRAVVRGVLNGIILINMSCKALRPLHGRGAGGRRAARARGRERGARGVAAGGTLVGGRGLKTVGCREVDDAAVVSLTTAVCVNLV